MTIDGERRTVDSRNLSRRLPSAVHHLPLALNYYNYFSDIEELFIRRRGRNLLLSPLDWALIESWQEREVPLHIIVRGIERVFDAADKTPNKKRAIKSLLYCKEEIEAQFAEWLDSQVGKSNQSAAVSRPTTATTAGTTAAELKENSSASELFPDAAIAAHLARVGGEIEAAHGRAGGDWKSTLQTVAVRLNDLRGRAATAEKLEDSLEKLDALLDENLLRHFETATLKPDIERQLAAHKSRMEPEVYRRTFELMLVKRLREQADVPRLSLFYL